MELKGLLGCHKKPKIYGPSPCLCLKIGTSSVKKVGLEDFCRKELGCAHFLVVFRFFGGHI